LEILCPGLNELDLVTARIFDIGRDHKIWLLKGEIGAGKTTFMNALAKHLGVIDRVNSPSFGMINEYLTQNGLTLYHFDFFRISSVEEVLELGFFEYIDSDNYCFIEWPEKVEHLITGPYLEIIINVTEQDSRIFNIKIHV
jgi:tRNA threonylcarbamoyladenosine biosynthesis protein TsaE